MVGASEIKPLVGARNETLEGRGVAISAMDRDFDDIYDDEVDREEQTSSKVLENKPPISEMANISRNDKTLVGIPHETLDGRGMAMSAMDRDFDDIYDDEVDREEQTSSKVLEKKHPSIELAKLSHNNKTQLTAKTTINEKNQNSFRDNQGFSFRKTARSNVGTKSPIIEEKQLVLETSIIQDAIVKNL